MTTGTLLERIRAPFSFHLLPLRNDLYIFSISFYTNRQNVYTCTPSLQSYYDFFLRPPVRVLVSNPATHSHQKPSHQQHNLMQQLTATSSEHSFPISPTKFVAGWHKSNTTLFVLNASIKNPSNSLLHQVQAILHQIQSMKFPPTTTTAMDVKSATNICCVLETSQYKSCPNLCYKHHAQSIKARPLKSVNNTILPRFFHHFTKQAYSWGEQD